MPGTILQTYPSPTHLTDGVDLTDLSVYTTASVTAHKDRLILLAVMGVKATPASAAPTVTGLSTTWTLVTSADRPFDTEAATTRRVSVFRTSVAADTTGAITITWAAGQTVCHWSLDEFAGCDNTGTFGSGAVANGAATSVDTGTTRSVSVTPTNPWDASYFVTALSSVSEAAFHEPGTMTPLGLVSGSGTTTDSGTLHTAVSKPGCRTLKSRWTTSKPNAAVTVELIAAGPPGIPTPAYHTINRAGDIAPTVGSYGTNDIGSSVIAHILSIGGGMTLQFEGTCDGANWAPVFAYPLVSGTGATTTTAVGQWRISYTGLVGVRLSCTAYTSGTGIVIFSSAPVSP